MFLVTLLLMIWAVFGMYLATGPIRLDWRSASVVEKACFGVVVTVLGPPAFVALIIRNIVNPD